MISNKFFFIIQQKLCFVLSFFAESEVNKQSPFDALLMMHQTEWLRTEGRRWENDARVKSRRKACISSCSAGTVYHQHEVLYIIKPQVRCTLARDDMQGRRAALDDMHRTSRGDDIPSLRLG